ncbi:class I SAM-dependent methyltransferase [Salinisphaera sp.]|uniref:class I SAM-dependent methyltransferase n=1 Tax=Salinisphaera sp. TaxID=1914330 RepID=UPI002D77CD4F|nr:class I SAM-dependent methyltransferase [Salinisphaera sp.]HET7312851.1 class I SAM-dependent methyltransferase [Salinisphaera sp.]
MGPRPGSRGTGCRHRIAGWDQGVGRRLIIETRRQQSRITREYTRLARAYDTKWSFYVDATTRSTLSRLNLRAHERLLDIGCGTGVLLHRLSADHPALQLTGLDPVPDMLRIARHRLAPDLELCAGWAEALPFMDDRFDVVVCCSMFHCIARPDIALREVRRVLEPDGRLVITDWCGDYLTCRMLKRYLRLSDRAQTYVHRAHELRQLAASAGFAATTTDRYKISRLWGMMTMTLRPAHTSVPITTAR